MTAIDPPLSLRTIADLLVQHKLARKGDKNGFDCLLGLLKTRQILAVVTFPEVSSHPLAIPDEYWKKRSPDALRTLLRISNKGWTGTYKIKLRDVAAEAYRNAVLEHPEMDASYLAVQLIQSAHQTTDVEVLTSEWRRFSEALAPPDDADDARGRGRPRKDWEAVYKELAAVLWVYIDRANIEHPKHETIAGIIEGNLKALAVERAPKAGTIKDRLADVRTRVEELRTQLKNNETCARVAVFG